MDRVWGRAHYTSRKIQSNEDGYAGYELMRDENGDILRVASVVYWDADGHYWVKTFDTDIPVEVLEELIAETKENVKFK